MFGQRLFGTGRLDKVQLARNRYDRSDHSVALTLNPWRKRTRLVVKRSGKVDDGDGRPRNLEILLRLPCEVASKLPSPTLKIRLDASSPR